MSCHFQRCLSCGSWLCTKGGLLTEVVASHSHGTRRDKQQSIPTSTLSMSKNRTRAAVRRVYLDTFSNGREISTRHSRDRLRTQLGVWYQYFIVNYIDHDNCAAGPMRAIDNKIIGQFCLFVSAVRYKNTILCFFFLTNINIIFFTIS